VVVNPHIEEALALAHGSKDFKQRVGAVITDRRGRIISVGWNKRKTHPLQAKHAQAHNEEQIFLHAEIAALVKCRQTPHTIYVGRITRKGSAVLARPCPICMDAIIEAGIKTICYTADDGSVQYEGVPSS
jgi:deoxycytidylate deaminase